MAVGVGIQNIGNTSVANTDDLFIIGVRTETVDNNQQIVVSYDTQAISFDDLRTNLDFVDLADISVTEVAAVDGTDPSLSYDNTTGAFTYTKPYLISNTDIKSLFSAEDARITFTDGVIGLGAVDTDDVTEGTNLYYTSTRATTDARAAVSASGDISYNSSTGAFSYTERTDSEIRGLMSSGTGVTYNSTTGAISIGQDVGTTADVTFDTIEARSINTVNSNPSTGGVYLNDNYLRFSRVGGGGYYGIINQYDSSSLEILSLSAGAVQTNNTAHGGSIYLVGSGDTSTLGNAGGINFNTYTTASVEAGKFHANGQFEVANGILVTSGNVTATTFSGDLEGTADQVATISNLNTDDLPQGNSNLYYNETSFDASLAAKDTDDIAEGTTNLYYSDSLVDARIANTNINGLSDVNITQVADGSILSYNAGTQKWENVSAKDNLPLGTVQWFAGQPENIPAGWLVCDGSPVTTTYPSLRTFLADNDNPFGKDGSNNPLLPDLRGRFARGYNPVGVNNSPYNTEVGAVQDDRVISHSHDSGTLQTNTTGAHSHYTGLNPDNDAAFTFGGTTNGTGSARVDHNGGYNTNNPITSTNGDHSHTLTGSTGSHSTIQSSETRPRNVSLTPIIKAWGTLLSSANLGVADIAGLLNNYASYQDVTATSYADMSETKFMTPKRTFDEVTTILNQNVYNWGKTHYVLKGQGGIYRDTNWGTSIPINSTKETGWFWNRKWNTNLQMWNMRTEGFHLNQFTYFWIDVGSFLYGLNMSENMGIGDSWLPTSWNVYFKVTTPTLGFSAGDVITIPTNRDHVGNDEGNSQLFRLVNIGGSVNRLRFYIYAHDHLGDIMGFGQNGGVMTVNSGHFGITMEKNGPTSD